MTYSIVARDETTGALGAAVQTHWLAAGQVVPWVRPGVGAVCTQAFAEPAYGPGLLDRLAAGEPPQAALDALVAADPGGAVRQVGVVNAAAATAAHTGELCIAFAGHAAGAGFSVQANMMRSAGVWPAMAAAFAATSRAASLARRLLAALEAGEAAGGDVRGRQSAALVVAPAAGEPWRRDVDLRVDDHPQPLAELARLLELHEAYTFADTAEAHLVAGRANEASAAFDAALALAPGNTELRFWAALAVARSGELDRALVDLRAVIAAEPQWLQLLERLPAQIAPGAAPVLAALRES